YDYALTTGKPIHLCQELIERLLLLAGAADRNLTASASDRVQLVHEDDRGSVLACLLEQVADTGGADAYYHLHELRSAHREEWNASLARYRAREQRLPGTGRSHEKDTLWSGTAEPCVLGRRL